MTDAEKLFYGLLVLCLIVLLQLQLPTRVPLLEDACQGLVMADCGKLR